MLVPRSEPAGQGAVPVQKAKAILLGIEGSPPIAATGYELARLRCDTRGAVCTAPTPAAAGLPRRRGEIIVVADGVWKNMLRAWR